MLHSHYKHVNELNEWFALENPNEFLGNCVKFSNTIESLKDNPYFRKGLK